MRTVDNSAPGPRVSAVSIFYNAADYLGEAIDSVLAQDYRDFELLLVDDGSTDGSTEIAQRYAAAEPARIRVLHHPDRANRGASASRNLGLNTAAGELVAFIDADDCWLPEKLGEQLEILDRMPEVDAVCGTVNYWRSWAGEEDRLVPTGHVQNAPVPPGEATLSLYPLGNAAPPCPSDLLIRREAAMRVGGFEESFVGPMQLYEDQAFLAKLYLNATVYFADRIWLNYRLHDRSCVAVVTRSGKYHEVRRYFLEWFDQYLARQPQKRTFRISMALRRALLPYRHPRLTRLLRLVTGALRRTQPSQS